MWQLGSIISVDSNLPGLIAGWSRSKIGRSVGRWISCWAAGVHFSTLSAFIFLHFRCSFFYAFKCSVTVAYLLDGSVRKSGDRLRIAARLIRAENGYVVWSETYNRPLDDILRVQDDIA